MPDTSTNTFTLIANAYAQDPSIPRIAKRLKLSQDKVRRTLITLGLWSSPRSRDVVELHNQHYTTEEIAKKLNLSIKAVQSYLPYERGMYQEDEPSNDSVRSKLYKATLEEFRFLLNCDYNSKSPMAVVLSGQTELWDTKLKTQRYAAIRQRIDLNCVLPHLDRSETGKYIQAHMEYAGCTQQIFTDGALDVIYTESSGIMRLINRICERCLMYGCQQGKRLIDDHIVRYVVENEGVN